MWQMVQQLPPCLERSHTCKCVRNGWMSPPPLCVKRPGRWGGCVGATAAESRSGAAATATQEVFLTGEQRYWSENLGFYLNKNKETQQSWKDSQVQRSWVRAPKSNIYLKFRSQPSIINSCPPFLILSPILHHHESLISSLSTAFFCLSARLQRTFQQEALHLKNDISAQREPITISCEAALSESLSCCASSLPTQKHKQLSAAASWDTGCSSNILPIGEATDTNGPSRWCSKGMSSVASLNLHVHAVAQVLPKRSSRFSRTWSQRFAFSLKINHRLRAAARNSTPYGSQRSKQASPVGQRSAVTQPSVLCIKDDGLIRSLISAEAGGGGREARSSAADPPASRRQKHTRMIKGVRRRVTQ